jgi:hypothetical protein
MNLGGDPDFQLYRFSKETITNENENPTVRAVVGSCGVSWREQGLPLIEREASPVAGQFTTWRFTTR